MYYANDICIVINDNLLCVSLLSIILYRLLIIFMIKYIILTQQIKLFINLKIQKMIHKTKHKEY